MYIVFKQKRADAPSWGAAALTIHSRMRLCYLCSHLQNLKHANDLFVLHDLLSTVLNSKIPYPATEVQAKTSFTSVIPDETALNFLAGYGSTGKNLFYFRNS